LSLWRDWFKDAPMRLTLAFLICLGLAACNSRPAVQTPAPKPILPAVPPTPAPVIVPSGTNWQDWPTTAGDWAYRQDQRGSVALFGMNGADADFLIRCDRSARKIYVSRKGSFGDGESGRMTLRATTGLQTYAVANNGSTPPYISGEIATSDPHLDALAFSRGKFLVSVKGGADLVVPSWAEVARVIEDCRA
jgi:hypothetical protein